MPIVCGFSLFYVLVNWISSMFGMFEDIKLWKIVVGSFSVNRGTRQSDYWYYLQPSATVQKNSASDKQIMQITNWHVPIWICVDVSMQSLCASSAIPVDILVYGSETCMHESMQLSAVDVSLQCMHGLPSSVQCVNIHSWPYSFLEGPSSARDKCQE